MHAQWKNEPLLTKNPGRISSVGRNEGTPFALKAAGPSRGSDDHVKWRSRLH